MIYETVTFIGAAGFAVTGAAGLAVTAGLMLRTYRLTFSVTDALCAPFDYGARMAERMHLARDMASRTFERACFNGETAKEWEEGTEPHPLRGFFEVVSGDRDPKL